jgi:hypothetical protein
MLQAKNKIYAPPNQKALKRCYYMIERRSNLKEQREIRDDHKYLVKVKLEGRKKN